MERVQDESIIIQSKQKLCYQRLTEVLYLFLAKDRQKAQAKFYYRHF